MSIRSVSSLSVSSRFQFIMIGLSLHQSLLWLHQPWIQRVLVVLVAGALLLLGIFLTIPRIDWRLENVEFNKTSCQTVAQGSTGDGVFRILATNFAGSKKLIHSLCQSSIVGRQYSTVEVVWLPRREWQGEAFYRHKFDLLMSARDPVVTSLSEGQTRHYEKIAALNVNSPVYLASRDFQLTLDADHLRGQTLGVLNDTNSISRYKLPYSLLQQLHLEPGKDIEVKSYESDMALRHAFLESEVDLAPVFFDDILGEAFAYYRLGNTQGVGIFLLEPSNQALACEVFKLLPNYYGSLSKDFGFRLELENLLGDCPP